MKTVEIVNGIISKENLVEDLIIFGQFDCDANGDNGTDFISKEAIDLGYKNDLEYWANTAKKQYDFLGDEVSEEEKLVLAIEVFADNSIKSLVSCTEYIGYEITTDITTEGFLLTFAYVK